MAPRRGAQQQGAAAAARDALIEAIALDIIYEAARAATDETGAEVAAEVMAASGLATHASKEDSTTPSSEQAHHRHHATRTRSTENASPKNASQPSPKRPWLYTPAEHTRRLTTGC